MKLMLLIYSGSKPERISALLEASGAGAYTELAHAHGAGGTGRVQGTRAWPGEATLFLSIVPNEHADLRSAVRSYRAAAMDGERLHVATMPLDEFE